MARNLIVRHFAAATALSNGAFPFSPSSPTRQTPSHMTLTGFSTVTPSKIPTYRSSVRLWLSSSALERSGGGAKAREDEDGNEGGEGAVTFDGDYEENPDSIAALDDALDHDHERSEEEGDNEPATSPAQLLHDALSSSVSTAMTAVEKKSKSLQRELDKAKDLEATMARANLIVSNLYRLPPGTAKATVEDWENGGAEIELVLDTDNYSSAQDESDALFASARKMKRGSKVVEELLEKTDVAKEVLADGKLDLQAAATGGPGDGPDEGMLVLILERMERAASRTGFRMASLDDGDRKKQRRQQNYYGGGGGNRRKSKYQPTFRQLTSPSGLKVLVGRNRRDNEAICFQIARGDDVWMHARGCPGAHVLLQVRKGAAAPPTDADLQFAADLAAFYSDARTERRAAVTVAEPKHILKPRGAPPGAVKLRKEGPSLVGRPQDVSEDLKAAREESGGAWDEMGYQKLGGRARNKKRTEEARKKTVAKKKAEKRQKRKRGRHKLSRDSGIDDPEY